MNPLVQVHCEIETGSSLSSRAVSSQVLSAFKSLTTVFGMGTGVPLSYRHRLNV